MACLCQYFVTTINRKNQNSLDFCSQSGLTGKEGGVGGTAVVDKDNTTAEVRVSASELAASRAEIWVLKKNLGDAQISIENLENLVRTIIGKQNELLGEMYELKRQNTELRDECRMQRDYQTLERNAMIRELQDIKVLLGDRTRLLEETVDNNSELTSALQNANEKIYMMGMKFLKLKSSRSKRSSGTSSSLCSERSN